MNEYEDNPDWYDAYLNTPQGKSLGSRVGNTEILKFDLEEMRVIYIQWSPDDSDSQWFCENWRDDFDDVELRDFCLRLREMKNGYQLTESIFKIVRIESHKIICQRGQKFKFCDEYISVIFDHATFQRKYD